MLTMLPGNSQSKMNSLKVYLTLKGLGRRVGWKEIRYYWVRETVVSVFIILDLPQKGRQDTEIRGSKKHAVSYPHTLH